MDVQSDSKIVVAGRADVSDLEQQAVEETEGAVEETFVVIRVTTAGALDTTFASGTGTSYPNVVTGDPPDCDLRSLGDNVN